VSKDRPGAQSVLLDALASLAPKLPRRRQIVAYCRGPYCVYATTQFEYCERAGSGRAASTSAFPNGGAQACRSK